MEIKKKDRVLTEDGYATVIGIEEFRMRTRVLVRHDKQPKIFRGQKDVFGRDPYRNGVAYFISDLIDKVTYERRKAQGFPV